MFNAKHYVPVLKWKMGEKKAVFELPSKIKSQFTPVIELMAFHEGGKRRVTVDSYLSDNIDDISESFGYGKTAFIDTYDFDDDTQVDSGEHFLEFIFGYAASIGLKLIPVIDNQKCAEYINAASKVNTAHKTGICIRIQSDDFLDAESYIQKILSDVKVDVADTDIIFDLKYITQESRNSNILSLITLINSLSDIEKYRTITVCATSFPHTISAIPRNSTGEIIRTEWLLWKELIRRRDKIKRIPAFGDYNISNPAMVEFDPVTMQIGGKIKYTHENEFIIFKGSSIRLNGAEQMHDIAREAVNHGKYMGEGYSWGDGYIAKCARYEVSKGNSTTWVKVGVNHHLTFVTNQISSYPEL